MMAAGLPGLAAKVAFLRLSTSFPEASYRVDARETHMSWVFLLDEVVYKLKKPVRYDCLDYSTLEARRFYCEEELRLNRRLAPDVYLGLASLNLDQDGHLNLGGPGRPVDWLVRMRRLPAARMLDALILRGALSGADIERLAARLAAFYRSLPPAHPDPVAFRAALRRHVQEDAAGIVAAGLAPGPAGAVAGAALAFLSSRPDVFDARLDAGRVVEGHGDLRPEHVCFEPAVSIIDCLDFSQALRTVDVADETAFLALECDRLGAPDVAAALADRIAALLGDRPPPALRAFYTCWRCLSRARIALRHLEEPHLRHSAHWKLNADAYLRLGQAQLAGLGGQPAAGPGA